MEPETNKSEYSRAFKLITRYLAMRDHSRDELQVKLSQQFPLTLVQQLLHEAEVRGWLATEETIAERVSLTWSRQLKSRGYIESQLRRRNLPLPPSDDEAELEKIRILVTRKFGHAPRDLPFEEQERAKRFLLYRGFEAHMIGMVFDAQEF